MRWPNAWVWLLLVAGCDAGSSAAATDDPTSARASQFRSSAVTEAIDAASEVVQTRGFAGRDDEVRGFLVEHAVEARETPMRSGTCYVAIAAASAAMRELDLRIYDSDGVEVASDTDDGPRAGLRFCPTQTGTYYLTARATAGSGLYQLRTFRGPTGLEIRTDDLFRDVPASEAAREPR
ncbi:MAG: hypothetical protein H6719_02650 [Sandaracinaceae bacterium]|nr:hypothetical protein [Sandaracinaceae bacterium]